MLWFWMHGHACKGTPGIDAMLGAAAVGGSPGVIAQSCLTALSWGQEDKLAAYKVIHEASLMST